MSDLLQVKNLHSGYGAISVLRGVDLTVAPGKVTVVLGLNGMGKTTLLRAITGQLPVTQGEVLFRGERLNGLAPHVVARKGLILVPEGHPAFRDMTVEENLLMGAFAPERRAALSSGLARVYAMFPHLKGRRRQVAGSLSGGESQMLALGRGLLGEPSLLMVDEPSLGLAPVVVQEIFRIFASLKDQGLTILLVEQNTHKALALADHVYVLSSGKVVLSAPGKDVNEEELHALYFSHGKRAAGQSAEARP